MPLKSLFSSRPNDHISGISRISLRVFFYWENRQFPSVDGAFVEEIYKDSQLKMAKLQHVYSLHLRSILKMSSPFAPVSSSNRNPSFNKIVNSEVNLDEEVQLIQTRQDRELYEGLSEIFSILSSLEHIEKAYIKDTIKDEEYTPIVSRLLAQYNSLLKIESVHQSFGNLNDFTKKYWLNCPNAIRRIEVGIPATVEHNTSSMTHNSGSSTGLDNQYNNNNNSSATNSKAIAETTGSFITIMDAIKLNYKAKDQLHPLLSDLVQNINKVFTNGREFANRGKLVEWLIKLNKLNIYEELDDLESRQLSFDLDTAYKEFYSTL